MSYRTECPVCTEPQGIRVVTHWERVGDPPMVGSQEFIDAIEATCGCTLTDAEEDEALMNPRRYEEEAAEVERVRA